MHTHAHTHTRTLHIRWLYLTILFPADVLSDSKQFTDGLWHSFSLHIDRTHMNTHAHARTYITHTIALFDNSVPSRRAEWLEAVHWRAVALLLAAHRLHAHTHTHTRILHIRWLYLTILFPADVLSDSKQFTDGLWHSFSLHIDRTKVNCTVDRNVKVSERTLDIEANTLFYIGKSPFGYLHLFFIGKSQFGYLHLVWSEM